MVPFFLRIRGFHLLLWLECQEAMQGLLQESTLQALAALTGSRAYFTMLKPLTGPAHRRKEKGRLEKRCMTALTLLGYAIPGTVLGGSVIRQENSQPC